MAAEFHATLTHARLRAEQGDRSGAREILAELLARNPGNLAARRLLLQLDVRPDEDRSGESRERTADRQPADAAALADRFRSALGRKAPGRRRERIRRLETWLARIGGRP